METITWLKNPIPPTPLLLSLIYLVKKYEETSPTYRKKTNNKFFLEIFNPFIKLT
jgi:hypothetical protein